MLSMSEIGRLITLNQEVNHVQSSVPPVVIPTLQCNTAKLPLCSMRSGKKAIHSR